MKKAFTLIELVIIIIIIGILAVVAMPKFQDITIQAKMTGLYTTVAAIETAERTFAAFHGFYARAEDSQCPAEYWLPYTNQDGALAKFTTVLGIEVPAPTTFIDIEEWDASKRGTHLYGVSQSDTSHNLNKGGFRI